MTTRGTPGLAVAVAAAGGFLAWTGLTGQTTVEGLRNLASGRPASTMTPGSRFGRAGATAVTGIIGAAGDVPAPHNTRIAASLDRYIGVPYRWGGESPSTGWDCSGAVTWVLHRDVGLQLPSNTHTTAAQFLVWSGARTIPRSRCSAGDLVCWASHIGIAVSRDRMWEAPGQGKRTRYANIRAGATIRRVQ